MIHKEIQLNEFEKADLHSAETMLKILQHKFRKEYQETIDGLIAFCQDMDTLDGREPRKYSTSEIHEIFEDSEIIDYLDGLIDDEILVNYIVTDKVGTEKGMWHMIIESGYALI